MNSGQAKEILVLYRPNAADAQDAQFAEALQLVPQDRQLAAWFEAHCASYTALRARFKEIQAPVGLKEQILSERRVNAQKDWRRPALLAAATVIAILLVLAGFWSRSKPKDTFADFRTNMVSTALRTYSMDFETNDLNAIRGFLAQKQAHADYVLPRSLESAASVGCVVLTWHGKGVSMICFRSGKPLPPDQKSDLFLFVIDRSAIPDVPPENQPQLQEVKRLLTASWSRGDKTYLLAGDEGFLRQYF